MQRAVIVDDFTIDFKRRAGTLRKLVAVGTDRLFSILATIAAPTPRNGSRVEPSGTEVTGAGAADGAATAEPFEPARGDEVAKPFVATAGAGDEGAAAVEVADVAVAVALR